MRGTPQAPPLDAVLGSAAAVEAGRIEGPGQSGRLPLTPVLLRSAPSGDLFGLTQNVGMGWSAGALGGPEYVIVSTAGGVRGADGTPIALGYHTGHWEIGLLVREAAETLRGRGAIPFAAFCSDPCDGRTQGTTGMFDSLPYRNDAAIVMRRLIRSLPTAQGVLGIATCDKGLPATMLALAGCATMPGVIVPGGVTLPASGAEDAGQVQSLGARFSHDLVSLDYAAEMGCRACGSSGGGCQFLGTAATSQVVAEALGMALPHSALAPSGEPSWTELGTRSALALLRLHAGGHTTARYPHGSGDRACDAGARRLWRVDQSPAAHSGDRPCGGAAHPDGRRLDPGQSRHAATRGCAPQRTARASHGAGLHGRRRPRGDVAPASHGTARPFGPDGDRRHPRDVARLVGRRASGDGRHGGVWGPGHRSIRIR